MANKIAHHGLENNLIKELKDTGGIEAQRDFSGGLAEQYAKR